MFTLTTFRSLAAAALLALGLATPGVAATVAACSADVASKVTGTSDCEVLTFGSGQPTQSEIDLLFPPNPGWKNIGGLVLTGDNQSGTWSISQALFDSYARLMVVFKGPDQASPVQPKGVVAYLLSDITGTYDTPFNNPMGGQPNPMDISGVSLYAAIPLPAGGLLLLTALGGLGIAARRRRKAQAA